MPRKYKSNDRFLKPDPKHGSLLISKFVNCLMWDGKKSTATRVVYDALGIIEKKMPDRDPLVVFLDAIANVKPRIEVRSKRVGGATYQVPMEVSPKRQQALAFRWIIQAVRAKKGRPTARKLSDEILSAYRREGVAFTTRENVHKMAEANKAFAHFAW
ncbi:MAG: 30S ribosomal protein S7 [Planctomycetota bacterium]|nr:MAG: 30S ribosomal protein S7 [Planctomycetota bacterium]